MKEYIAENGESVFAMNEVQEAAFESAGLKPVDEPKRGRPKAEQ